ncbi:PH domain-containing protein [Aestuariimicrobium sp. p3-SID1156]|uniref:PH domain-containing protein n=1 Tax=Aestuariimicrobium sp. p3-SID1156 TaxID=2916038 RepID=UPI00223AF2C4|nr:PH domain-containing protein [Aestuariimicrobium sp. p3-SID1156]MCT1458310.1 PH domain-containing protein [Aestuariimicrobium sp. p3-SID1156]
MSAEGMGPHAATTATVTTDPVFLPAGYDWKPLDPKYATVELINTPIGWLVLAAITLVPTVIWAPRWAALALGAFWVLIILWRTITAGRRARAWHYAQTEHDLMISHGLMFKELQVIPYGRMQTVEVSAGPILRSFGLATVTMKTATDANSAMIPGLAADEADRLREELSRLGEEQAAEL